MKEGVAAVLIAIALVIASNNKTHNHKYKHPCVHMEQKKMHISDKGMELIKKFEGLRLEAYKNKNDVWTIGYGHTKTAHKGKAITKEEAEELLRFDLEWAEKAVCNHVKVKLTQNQFDALVSFTFNLGEANFVNSTLLKRVNRNQHNLVPKELTKWVYREHETLKGLARRRVQEAKLYLED